MGYSVFDDNNIIMTKGDTARIQIEILNNKGEPYIPLAGDSVLFTLKHYVSDRTILLSKDISIENLYLMLDPEDTKDLSLGDYCFDIQLVHASGKTDTFIENKILRLTGEVG